MKIYDASMYIRKYMDGHPYEHNEVSITTEFINQISTEHRVKSFIFTQGNEAVTGSDWLWVILTDSGVYKFLVQAKKLHRCKTYITKTQAAYMSNSGERQIELLQKYAAKTKAVPIYVLYSDRIDQFPCVKTKNTEEGVFFEPAEKVFEHYFRDVEREKQLQHSPISCLFACFSQKCNYNIPHTCKRTLCVVCQGCGREKACKSNLVPCAEPFERPLWKHYGIRYTASPIQDFTLLFMFAESVLRHRPSLQIYCLYPIVNGAQDIIDRIVITDYVNRHGQNYLSALLGENFAADQDNILSKSDIEDKITVLARKYPYFKQIGLFGSYAKDTASKESDVDIALVYDLKKIKSEEDLEKLISFFKETSIQLRKNIDFVDYLSTGKGEPFRTDIDKYIDWFFRTV